MSRTYTDTPEPRYVERAAFADNVDSDLPEPTIADAGKVLGVDESGDYVLVEGGEGGGGTPIMHVVEVNQVLYGTHIDNVSENMTSISVNTENGGFTANVHTFIDYLMILKNFDVTNFEISLVTYDENGTSSEYTGVHNLGVAESWMSFETGGSDPSLRYYVEVTSSSATLEYALIVDLDTGAVVYEVSGE